MATISIYNTPSEIRNMQMRTTTQDYAMNTPAINERYDQHQSTVQSVDDASNMCRYHDVYLFVA